MHMHVYIHMTDLCHLALSRPWRNRDAKKLHHNLPTRGSATHFILLALIAPQYCWLLHDNVDHSLALLL